jgi:CRP/FNR family transcriptional regulator
LAQLLVEMADTDHIVNATHDELATELGTAREVVSRLLKEFERNGWVKLFRKRILIINTQGLKALGAWMNN